MSKKVTEVFGISNEVLVDSYVDRGDLDEELSALVGDGKLHVALRGASKCGKSWLRRRVLTNPVVVQCRLNKTGVDIYTEALSELGIEFRSETTKSHEIKGSVKGTAEAGWKLLAKAGLEIEGEASAQSNKTSTPVGRDINDLRFIADILKKSGRPFVIEDFHYLSLEHRTDFAFDLKAFWDWGLQVIIIGVWSADNMLLSLNSDLAGRLEEIEIAWSNNDLGKILDAGGHVLNLQFANPLRSLLIEAAYGNAGQLQTLALRTLKNLKVTETNFPLLVLSDCQEGEYAAMQYAEQLNTRYQTFAISVAQGIRRRTRSTNIYAHAMAVIMNANDSDLINGLSVDRIFEQAKNREPRILLGNLKSILAKIESLQIDSDGRGLVLAYNPDQGVTAVDRQLLLYRRFATVNWPWKEIILAASSDSFEPDDDGAQDSR